MWILLRPRSCIVASMVLSIVVIGCSTKDEYKNSNPPAASPAKPTTGPNTKPSPPHSNESPSVTPPAREEISPPPSSTLVASSQPAAKATDLGGDSLVTAGVAFTVPSGWVKKTPSSSMRLAEYSLPGDAGAGELTIFCFGPGQGGGVQANIDRWIGQFTHSEDPSQPVKSSSESFKQDGLTITVVKAGGIFSPESMAPNAPKPPPIADASLYGIIVEGGPQGSVFVKVTGPRATIDGHEAALHVLAHSVRKPT